MHREFHTVAGRSKRVLGSIKKQLTGVELCKDMLVILPTEHIVRGFLIEATSTKDRIYLWKVVTPLHRPMRDVILDYSDRIFPETGEDIYIYKDDYERSIDRLRALVANHMAGLSRIRSPCDFLRHIDWMRGNKSTLFRFDLALTYFRIGRVRECANLLCALDSEIDQHDRTYLGEHQLKDPVADNIKQATRALQQGPIALAALLDRWEQINVDRLGLQPSRSQ